MKNLQTTLEGALDSIRWLEEAIQELELKAENLVTLLETHSVPADQAYDLFKTLSQIRYHLSETGEYQSILQESHRQSRRKSQDTNPLKQEKGNGKSGQEGSHEGPDLTVVASG